MTFRKLIFQGHTWEYFVGRGNVVIKDPHGAKYTVGIEKVKGVTPDVIERGQHKRTTDGMIRPSDVRAYIERTF